MYLPHSSVFGNRLYNGKLAIKAELKKAKDTIKTLIKIVALLVILNVFVMCGVGGIVASMMTNQRNVDNKDDELSLENQHNHLRLTSLATNNTAEFGKILNQLDTLADKQMSTHQQLDLLNTTLADKHTHINRQLDLLNSTMTDKHSHITSQINEQHDAQMSLDHQLHSLNATLKSTQVNTSQHVATLEQAQAVLTEGQAATNSSLHAVKEAQKNASLLIEILREGQAATNSSLHAVKEAQNNASLLIETLREGQAATNSSLDAVKETQTNAGQQIEILTERIAATNGYLDILNETQINAGQKIETLTEGRAETNSVINALKAKLIFADCSERYAAGLIEDGVYNISPDGLCSFPVYCDMTGGGWTLIQARIDGSVKFDRSWDEYVKGFGNIDGDHWLGLDKIHRLTDRRSEIYFQLEYYDGSTGFAHYQSFRVGSKDTVYQMMVDTIGYNGTIDELFSLQNNMKFSTRGHDNDESPNSECAARNANGGWWYKACSKLGNLNGVFGKRSRGGIAYWEHDFTMVLLKTVRVKVKLCS